MYKPHSVQILDLTIDKENSKYSGYSFTVNGSAIQFRVAKITPRKIGQFVVLYKRNASGCIAPYDIKDNIDMFIVSCHAQKHFGYFIFPKKILIEKKILSNHGLGGKRAIRVYPPWDTTTSRQATKTQQWQTEYFKEMPSESI